jgi:hypothetical protein
VTPLLWWVTCLRESSAKVLSSIARSRDRTQIGRRHDAATRCRCRARAPGVRGAGARGVQRRSNGAYRVSVFAPAPTIPRGHDPHFDRSHRVFITEAPARDNRLTDPTLSPCFVSSPHISLPQSHSSNQVTCTKACSTPRRCPMRRYVPIHPLQRHRVTCVVASPASSRHRVTCVVASPASPISDGSKLTIPTSPKFPNAVEKRRPRVHRAHGRAQGDQGWPGATKQAG